MTKELEIYNRLDFSIPIELREQAKKDVKNLCKKHPYIMKIKIREDTVELHLKDNDYAENVWCDVCHDIEAIFYQYDGIKK